MQKKKQPGTTTMLSERQNETAFLKRCLEFAEDEEGRQLCKRIVQVQHDQRCLCRAMWLMVLLAALSLASLVYAMILQVDFRESELQLAYKVICGLLLTSLFCLATFGALLLLYHRSLNHLRQKCRRVITNLLESRQSEACVLRRNGELMEQEVIALRSGSAMPALTKASLPGAS